MTRPIGQAADYTYDAAGNLLTKIDAKDPLEGTNNKIKTMKRQAYGFRDKEFFKLKIMAIHLTKYALVGWTLIWATARRDVTP